MTSNSSPTGWGPWRAIRLLAGLWAASIGTWRLFELVDNGVTFVLPGYPDWLPRWFLFYEASLGILGLATVLHAALPLLRAWGFAVGAVGAALVMAHGAVLIGFDRALRQGGMFYGLVDVLTLVRVHDDLGPTAAGLAGYRVGQVAGLAVALVWPAASWALSARRSRRDPPTLGTRLRAGLGLLGAIGLVGATIVAFVPRAHVLTASVPHGWWVVSDPSGLEIAFPPAWRHLQSEMPAAIDDTDGGYASCNVMGYLVSSLAGLPDDERLDRFEEELDPSQYGALLEHRRVELSGRPAVLVVADHEAARPQGDVELRSIQWILPMDGEVVQLTCTTYRGTFDVRRGELESIARHLVPGASP